MGASTNKPDQHLRYESAYPALNNPAGLRILLSDYHALKGRRFAGDTAASDILIDLHRAIELANLTARQRQALTLVYGEDLAPKDAGERLGTSRQAIEQHVEKALEEIGEIYYYWSGHGEGYAADSAKGDTA